MPHPGETYGRLPLATPKHGDRSSVAISAGGSSSVIARRPMHFGRARRLRRSIVRAGKRDADTRRGWRPPGHARFGSRASTTSASASFIVECLGERIGADSPRAKDAGNALRRGSNTRLFKKNAAETRYVATGREGRSRRGRWQKGHQC